MIAHSGLWGDSKTESRQHGNTKTRKKDMMGGTNRLLRLSAFFVFSSFRATVIGILFPSRIMAALQPASFRAEMGSVVS
jgi:hypothetical protein